MSAPQQLGKQLLASLTRCTASSLGWQQLPFLQIQQQLPSCTPLVTASSCRGYAQLPASQPTHHIIQQAAPPQQQQQPKRSDQPVIKLYKGIWIVPVRFLVRAKVFQLMGGGSIGILIGSLSLAEATWMDVAAITGLAGGMVAATCCLWYYSRRYVGEMSLLLPDRQHVRFSVLNFWGNREDNDVPISSIVPPFKGVRPKEVARIANQLLFPVNVTGDRQYYFNNIQNADILERQIFFSILKGEYDPSQAGQQDQEGVTDRGSNSQQQEKEQQLRKLESANVQQQQ